MKPALTAKTLKVKADKILCEDDYRNRIEDVVEHLMNYGMDPDEARIEAEQVVYTNMLDES
jgi:hypothetical protein